MLAFVLHFYSGQPLQNLSGVDTAVRVRSTPPIARPAMNWHRELVFRITPKSGPLRPLETLLDASRAMMQDLSSGDRRKPFWRDAGWAVVEAVDRDSYASVARATECLVTALDAEGWMMAKRPNEVSVRACLDALASELRACVVPLKTAKPRTILRLIHGTSAGEPGIAVRAIRPVIPPLNRVAS